MTVIRRVADFHEPDSPFIRDLSGIFCSARAGRLQFLIDLHSRDEDRHFLSGVVLRNNEVWTAERAGRLAGFIAFSDEWVNHLYIGEKFQRLGLGRRLLNVAKQSRSLLNIWVFEINTPAIAFYENQGFQIAERTDGSGNEAGRPDVRMQWRASAARAK